MRYTSWERKFLGAKFLRTSVPGSERAREWKFRGTKVLGNELARVLWELLLQGANWPGSEKAQYLENCKGLDITALLIG